MDVPVSRRAWLGAGVGLAGGAVASSAAGDEPRPAGLHLAPDYSVVFQNTDRRLYVEGCGLERLADGTLVAVVPVVPRSVEPSALRPTHSRVHVLRSGDGGKTWTAASQLPYYSARPWAHGGALYLFAFQPGTKHRNDDLHLLRSRDGGATWSDPVALFRGHGWNCQTGMAVRDGRLYWAFDDLGAGLGAERTHRVVAGDLGGDPTDPRAWRVSEPVAFPGVPAAFANPKFGKRGSQWLEPNLLDVGGHLRLLSTVKPWGQTTTNLGAVCDVTDEGGKLGVLFTQFHPMPGGQLKFCVVWDRVSRLFWATSNLAADGQGRLGWKFSRGGGGNDRRFLMLWYGADGLNWFPAGCVAQARKLSQSFMYAAPVVDGDDLAVIVRSSVAAPDQHDADRATFHRVRNFRRLALNLVPDPEA